MWRRYYITEGVPDPLIWNSKNCKWPDKCWEQVLGQLKKEQMLSLVPSLQHLDLSFSVFFNVNPDDQILTSSTFIPLNVFSSHV